jgi:hypothetical protein
MITLETIKEAQKLYEERGLSHKQVMETLGLSFLEEAAINCFGLSPEQVLLHINEIEGDMTAVEVIELYGLPLPRWMTGSSYQLLLGG